MAVTPYSDEFDIDNDIDDEIDEDLKSDYENQPNKTFKMLDNVKRFNGVIDEQDGEEAIKQTVFCILQTQRYSCEIYSDNYGFEYEDLIGKDINYICAVLPSRIKDALTVDDRIEDVTNFAITQNGKNKLDVSFTVVTGSDNEIDINTEVNMNV